MELCAVATVAAVAAVVLRAAQEIEQRQTMRFVECFHFELNGV